MAKDFVQLVGPFNFTAAELIGANLLVKLDTNGCVVLAGAGDAPLGFVYDGIADDALGAVEELRGKMQLVAGGAITAGDYVKAGANGKVVAEAVPATPTEFTIGQALNTAAADGYVYVFRV